MKGRVQIMWWWVGAIVSWLIGAGWIIAVMAGVFRGKTSGFSLKLLPAYLFHGGFAILAIWMLIRAINTWYWMTEKGISYEAQIQICTWFPFNRSWPNLNHLCYWSGLLQNGWIWKFKRAVGSICFSCDYHVGWHGINRSCYQEKAIGQEKQNGSVNPSCAKPVIIWPRKNRLLPFIPTTWVNLAVSIIIHNSQDL